MMERESLAGGSLFVAVKLRHQFQIQSVCQAKSRFDLGRVERIGELAAGVGGGEVLSKQADFEAGVGGKPV